MLRRVRSDERCQRRRLSEPEHFDAVLNDLNKLILPACTQWLDPRFFAYFPSNSSLAAVLGDYVSTGLGQLGLNWQASPALTELEEVVDRLAAADVGPVDAWSGVIQDTASTGALVALICARERSDVSRRYARWFAGVREAAGGLRIESESQLRG